MGMLGKLLIELGANTARLQSDMGKAVGIAEKAASKIQTAFKFAGGGLIGAALANTVKQSIQFGDEISKAAAKSGIGAKSMSELAYAAKLADVDIKSLSTAIKKMQVSISEAGSGAKGPTQTLRVLGLTVEQVLRRRPEQQFELLAQRISELKDPADRARAATELFGKAGADLLPLFEQGAAGIRKAREEAQKLGLSFSQSDISKLADADHAIKRLDAAWTGFATTLAAKVAPPLTRIFELLSGIDTRSGAQQIDDQIKSIEKVLEGRTFGMGMGIHQSGIDDTRRQALTNQLAQLRARRALLSAPGLAETGGRRSVRPNMPMGYAAVAAAEEAERIEAKRAKTHKEAANGWVEVERKMFEDQQRFSQENLEKLNDDLWSWRLAQRSAHLEMIEMRAAERKELSETSKIFRDGFLNAWDDMVNGGKLKWDELLRYMIAQVARRGIVNLLDVVLPKKGSTIGGLAGGSTVLGGLWKILGFAKGGHPQAGRPRIVGENGPELEVPGYASTIFPNHMLGGMQAAPVLNITNNVDMRGATQDAMKLLPRVLKQNNDFLEARIVERLRRGWYG
jgi:hypothetical protein